MPEIIISFDYDRQLCISSWNETEEDGTVIKESIGGYMKLNPSKEDKERYKIYAIKVATILFNKHKEERNKKRK